MRGSRPTACLDEDEAARFIEGALAGDEQADVIQHLAACDACRTWVGALALLERSACGDASDGDADPTAPGPQRPSIRWPASSSAATI